MASKHTDHPRALTRARRKRPPGKRNGLTPRVRKAIEHLVFGLDDHKPAETLKEAAEAAGITDRALRAAFLKPAVLAHYRQECKALREGERARNIRVAAEIRDDGKLKQSAAGQKVRLDAARQLDQDLYDQNAPINVGVQVNVETPGYVIDLSEFPPEPKTIDYDAADLSGRRQESGNE